MKKSLAQRGALSVFTMWSKFQPHREHENGDDFVCAFRDLPSFCGDAPYVLLTSFKDLHHFITAGNVFTFTILLGFREFRKFHEDDS